jgi:hypothetical protein
MYLTDASVHLLNPLPNRFHRVLHFLPGERLSYCACLIEVHRPEPVKHLLQPLDRLL